MRSLRIASHGYVDRVTFFDIVMGFSSSLIGKFALLVIVFATSLRAAKTIASSFLVPPICDCVHIISDRNVRPRSYDWWMLRVAFRRVACVDTMTGTSLKDATETLLKADAKNLCVSILTSGRFAPLDPLLMDTIRALRSDTRTRRLGIIHVGDEMGLSETWFYDYFDYVLRHFHYPKQYSSSRKRHVHWLPLGTRNGNSTLVSRDSFSGLRIGISASRRSFFGNFLGNMRPYRMGQLIKTRLEMLRSIETLKWVRVTRFKDEKSNVNGNLYAKIGQRRRTGSYDRSVFVVNETRSFGEGSKSVYADVLARSIFTLAPEGTGVETFRIWEALEAGSIPVIKEGHAWERLDSDHPLIVVPSWSAASIETALSPFHRMRLTGDDAAIDAYQHRVATWWLRFKSDLQLLCANLLVGRSEGQCERATQDGNASTLPL